MSELTPLQTQLNNLISNLAPAKRTLLAREVGRNLAQSQRKRIALQQNPDGSSYIPRRVQSKNRKGKLKRKAMFMKLRTARFMRLKTTANGVELGYQGNNAMIAEVHQYGKESRVSRKANWKVKYDQRELLGFSENDVQMVEDAVIAYLAGK